MAAFSLRRKRNSANWHVHRNFFVAGKRYHDFQQQVRQSERIESLVSVKLGRNLSSYPFEHRLKFRSEVQFGVEFKKLSPRALPVHEQRLLVFHGARQLHKLSVGCLLCVLPRLLHQKRVFSRYFARLHEPLHESFKDVLHVLWIQDIYLVRLLQLIDIQVNCLRV